MNRQISLYREYNGNGSNIPELFSWANNEIIDEGVSIALDINDRYSYMQSGKGKAFELFPDSLKNIYLLIENQLSQWG